MSEITPPFDTADVVHRYTRAEAISDGTLIDLTSWAKETGFVIPVACTPAVWHGYIVPDESLRGGGQSERGRGHDLLWMLWCAIKRGEQVAAEQLVFEVIFLMAPARQVTACLRAICGPGNNDEPVLTIMMPEED